MLRDRSHSKIDVGTLLAIGPLVDDKAHVISHCRSNTRQIGHEHICRGREIERLAQVPARILDVPGFLMLKIVVDVDLCVRTGEEPFAELDEGIRIILIGQSKALKEDLLADLAWQPEVRGRHFGLDSRELKANEAAGRSRVWEVRRGCEFSQTSSKESSVLR